MECQSTGGLFSTLEKEGHVNALKLKTVLFGLKSFEKYLKSIHIKVLCDNSTAVAWINKFDTSRSLECDSLGQEICELKQIFGQ